jgi:hypothetical protein
VRKLRKRNLGPILDANGWAVNAKAKLNVPFGASLTGVAALPPGAVVGGDDKFGEKRSAWPGIIKFVVIVAFIFSLLNHFYVLDMIAYKATGEHCQIFKQAPALPASKVEKTPAEKAASETADKAAGSLTNAPAAK